VSVAPGKPRQANFPVTHPDNIQEYEASVRSRTPGVDSDVKAVPFKKRLPAPPKPPPVTPKPIAPKAVVSAKPLAAVTFSKPVAGAEGKLLMSGESTAARIEARAEGQVLEHASERVTAHFPVLGWYVALDLVESDLMKHDKFNAVLDFLAPVPGVGEAAFGLQVAIPALQPLIVPSTQAEWDNLAWSVAFSGPTGLGF
jgi:hypothetical protein